MSNTTVKVCCLARGNTEATEAAVSKQGAWWASWDGDKANRDGHGEFKMN